MVSDEGALHERPNSPNKVMNSLEEPTVSTVYISKIMRYQVLEFAFTITLSKDSEERNTVQVSEEQLQ